MDRTCKTSLVLTQLTCLNPYSNGIWIEPPYLLVFYGICSSMTLLLPPVIQPLSHINPQSSQMLSFFDVKCWIFGICVRLILLIVNLIPFSESSQMMSRFSQNLAFAKTTPDFLPFFVCKYSHFSQISQVFSPIIVFCEKKRRYLKLAKMPKSS